MYFYTFLGPNDAKIPHAKMRRKGRKLTPSDEPTVPLVHSVGVLGTLRGEQMKMSPSDDPTVQFLDAPDELQRRSSEVSSTG
jgi:tryptophanyl-tRNA synthetase